MVWAQRARLLLWGFDDHATESLYLRLTHGGGAAVRRDRIWMLYGVLLAVIMVIRCHPMPLHQVITNVSLPFLLFWLLGFCHLAVPRLLPHRITCLVMVFPAISAWFITLAAGLLPPNLVAEIYPQNYGGPLAYGVLYAAAMRLPFRYMLAGGVYWLGVYIHTAVVVRDDWPSGMLPPLAHLLLCWAVSMGVTALLDLEDRRSYTVASAQRQAAGLAAAGAAMSGASSAELCQAGSCEHQVGEGCSTAEHQSHAGGDGSGACRQAAGAVEASKRQAG